MMRIAIATLGCKANQYDSQVIREAFEEKQCTIVPLSQEADVYVVNTCTVTGKTDYQSRQLIRRIHRDHPGARIAVTGCYAQTAPEEIQSLPGVFLIAGNLEKEIIGDLALKHLHDHEPCIAISPPHSVRAFPARTVTSFSARTRFFFKIQEGCDNRCSYCIIPAARGRSRSMEPERVMELLTRISAAGFKEVVLTGIHLGAYGEDLTPPMSLFQLLEKIEHHHPLPRIRLSSLEPNEVDGRLIGLLASSSVFCHHLHVPLQSGSDHILQLMNRPYRTNDFRRLVAELTNAVNDLALGVDVIVGFPGETEEDFMQTCQLVDDLPLSYLHVFPFSPRRGTPAAAFPDRPHGETVKARAFQLRLLSMQKKTAFYRRFAGRTLPVLFENIRDRATGLLKGFSRNYIPILADGPDTFMNQEIPVLLLEVQECAVRGTIDDAVQQAFPISLSARCRGEKSYRR